jgi:4-amino-4-deoxy-L-arabinose transferase-like glycosyltransferase
VRASCLRLLDHPRAPHAVIGGGLALRLAGLYAVTGLPITGDAQSYYETATQLARGAAYEPHWPPGLPALLSAAFVLFGEKPIVARAVMLLVYLGFCVAVLACGRRVVGPRATTLALAVFAVKPMFVWVSLNPLTQLPTAALLLGAVAFALRLQRGGGAGTAVSLGACLAGLVLTRPSNVGLALVLPAYLSWCTRRWQTLAIPVLVTTFFLGAWSLRAHRMTGRLVLINDANSQNIFYGNNPWTPTYRTWWYGSHKEPGEAHPGFLATLHQIGRHTAKERDRLYTKVALDHIRARPDLFLYRTAARIRTSLAYDTFASAQVAKRHGLLGQAVLVLDAVSFLFLWGLALAYSAAARNGRDGAVRLLLLAALLYAAPYFLSFSHPTFIFPAGALVGLLGCGAAVGLLEGGARAAWERLGRRGQVALGGAMLAFLAVQVEWTVHLLERVG